jgi:hypothetical protein
MKSLLLNKEGTLEPLKPTNGTHFTLAELRKALDCEMIEVIYLNDTDNIMIGDEEGRLKDDYVINPIATKIYQESWNTRNDIVGDVILCPSSMLR